MPSSSRPWSRSSWARCSRSPRSWACGASSRAPTWRPGPWPGGRASSASWASVVLTFNNLAGPAGTALRIAVVVLGYVQAWWLVAGALDFARSTTPPGRQRRVAVVLASLLAVASAVALVIGLPSRATTVVRFVLPPLALGAFSLAAALLVKGRRPAPPAVGDRLLAFALAVYGGTPGLRGNLLRRLAPDRRLPRPARVPRVPGLPRPRVPRPRHDRLPPRGRAPGPPRGRRPPAPLRGEVPEGVPEQPRLHQHLLAGGRGLPRRQRGLRARVRVHAGGRGGTERPRDRALGGPEAARAVGGTAAPGGGRPRRRWWTSGRGRGSGGFAASPRRSSTSTRGTAS